MNSLFFWVRITNIPPALEKPDIIEDAAIVAGSFIQHDDREWKAKKKIRVRVEHGIEKPFIQMKTIKFEAGVEADISYFYENLTGLCKRCKLIFHLSGECTGVGLPVRNAASVQKENLIPSGTSAFGLAVNGNSSAGTFCFSRGNSTTVPSVSQFNSTASKSRKPVVRRKETRSISSELTV